MGAFPSQEVVSTHACARCAASYGHVSHGYFHTLLTSAFSHHSMGHIFSNMFTFYFFGSSLAQIIGSARVRISSANNGLVFSHMR